MDSWYPVPSSGRVGPAELSCRPDFSQVVCERTSDMGCGRCQMIAERRREVGQPSDFAGLLSTSSGSDSCLATRGAAGTPSQRMDNEPPRCQPYRAPPSDSQFVTVTLQRVNTHRPQAFSGFSWIICSIHDFWFGAPTAGVSASPPIIKYRTQPL